MSETVFFSWQSDRPARDGRNFIEAALERALERISKDLGVEEAVRENVEIDCDTKGVPGSPPIFQTILSKIDEAAAFVADLTICGTRPDNRVTPNPNVLIEYGWALKSLTYHRVITVMNTAFGGPDGLPFDLAHLRFPIRYDLPPDAADDVKKRVRAKLVDELHNALKAVFMSDNFKKARSKQEERPRFQPRKPLNTGARFRLPGQALGYAVDLVAELTGTARLDEIKLADGPAHWLRVMPFYATAKTVFTQEIRQLAGQLSIVPLLPSFSGTRFLRGEDGGGFYSDSGEGQLTRTVAYVFNTGEIWLVNAFHRANYVELDEDAYAGSLEQCVSLLERIGYAAPYQWVAGMDGVRGRQLVINGRQREYANGHVMLLPAVTHGPCVTHCIQASGTFNKGDSAAQVMRGFFERVYDQFGARRPVR